MNISNIKEILKEYINEQKQDEHLFKPALEIELVKYIQKQIYGE